MQLFGFAVKQTLDSTVAIELNSQLDLLQANDKITADFIVKTSKNMQCALKLIPNVEAIPVKRIIEAIRDQQGGRGKYDKCLWDAWFPLGMGVSQP